MTVENPTAEGGASITERLEAFLSAPEETTTAPAPSEPPKADIEPEYEASEETEVETPESDEPDESEGPQLSISDVAKILGVDESTLDVDEDGTVKVKTKIDGKEGAAKFNDLLKSYQLQGHVDAKAREAAETHKALQERMQQFEQFAQSEAQKLTQLAYVANQELMRDAGNVDWENLARNDPAEYVAKQHEFQQRQHRVNQLMSEAQQQHSQYQQAQQMRYQQSLQAEAERLPTLIPEWSDAKVAQAEKIEMRDWMKKNGFTDQDISSLTRADLVATLRKAMLFDKGQQKATITEKKVRAAPKLVKPGTPKDANQRATEQVRELKQQVRKAGGKANAVAEYLMATGRV